MKVLKTSILALSLALLSSSAWAETVTVKNGSVSVDVADKQMSRITVRGAKIASVHQIDDPTAPQLLIQSDDKTGDMYVGFGSEAVGRTYSSFITTEDGDTFQLLLHPTEIQPASIEIVPENKKSQASTPTSLKTAGYAEALVAFDKLMFNKTVTDGVVFTPANDPGTHLQNLTVRTLGYYKTEGLTGIELDVRNHSTVPQQLKCEQFMVKYVLACGITNEILDPGQSSRVYIEQEDAR